MALQQLYMYGYDFYCSITFRSVA